MTPERETVVNGKKIQEYYWAGRMVVYVNNYKSERTYEEEIQYQREATDEQ